jgi:hypothetical protein
MRRRCSNSNARYFKDYGGRGIKVCTRWLGRDGFENFFADMGECPVGFTLDRRDNDGDYEPSNCRWATRKEQARNRRSSRDITIDGRTMTLAAWAEALSVKYTTLRNRLYAGTWP